MVDRDEIFGLVETVNPVPTIDHVTEDDLVQLRHRVHEKRSPHPAPGPPRSREPRRLGWRGPLIAFGTAALILVLVAAAAVLLFRGDGSSVEPADTVPTRTVTTTVTTPEVSEPAVLALIPAAGVEPVSVSTVLGDIEFTTWVLPNEGGPPGQFPPGLFTEYDDGIIAHILDIRAPDSGWARSLDGVTWTQIPDPVDPARTAIFNGHGAAGPRGVVTVDRAQVYYSADGTEFSEATQPPHRAAHQGSGGCMPHGWPGEGIMTVGPAAATENGFVVLASRGAADWYETPVCEPLVWFSTDGDKWALTSEESPFGKRSFVVDMAVASGRVVAVGGFSPEEAAVWVSDDGITWTRADLDATQMWKVAGGTRGWIAVGTHTSNLSAEPAGDMWFSTDGLVWDGPYVRPPGWDGTSYSIVEVAMLDDRIVGTGEGRPKSDSPPAGVVIGVFLDE